MTQQIFAEQEINEKYGDATITTINLRQFSGTVKLNFSTMRYCSLEHVKIFIKDWIEQRSIENKINLSITLSNVETTMYFSSYCDIVEESTVNVYGNIGRENINVSDDEIIKTLIELFTYLKNKTKQDNITFNFQGHNKNVYIEIH